MPDFLDRFGDQLRAAQSVPQGQAATAGRPPRRRRRVLIGALGVLALAAPAAAVVGWNPSLGRDADGPVSSSDSPVVAVARDSFGVLRRDQSAADRHVAAPLLRTLTPRTNGVQTDAVRALRRDWVLVPVDSVETGPGRTTRDALCITNGDGIACSPARSAATAGVSVLAANGSATTVSGLVPDGVDRVRYTMAGGSVLADVSANFYTLEVAATAPRGTIAAPPGSEGPARIPGPPRPVQGTLEWLSAGGAVVGPSAG